MLTNVIHSQVDCFNFPIDASVTQQLYWLGDDYPTEIAQILQRGWQKQQPGTELLAVICLERPECVMSVLEYGRSSNIQAVFHLKVLLRDPHQQHWLLEVSAQLEGKNLDTYETGKIISDIHLLHGELLSPTGAGFLEQLQIGVWCENRQTLLEWDTLLEEFLVLSDAEVEMDGEIYYLSWPNESILGGMEGELLASFLPDQPALHYLTFSPERFAVNGRIEDGLLPEWEHLTRLFGPPTEKRAGSGYRWIFDDLEILLLYRPCNEFHFVEDYHKWIAIHHIVPDD